ncbi:HSP20 family protein [Malonomonas rubra DSM 5091]|uniref:HSP20 family protein n=1 Tax=Malonomonas rubra DSM 5091 TaxID=1122189 RepID=A0A1M6HZA2_MALRU|nr:Hsp20/alpha crystallin family protein [Malonomonas rubra]SHJ27493.1 HSP20 family protein [Malonomonas rubra DSM 5091]
MFGLQMIHEMDNMQREMEQLFRGLGFQAASCDMPQSGEIRVKDQGDAFQVEAVLPGLDAEKIDIKVLGRRLTLAGEFARPDIPEAANWHRRERSRGQFERNLQLAANIDAEKVEAEYQQGILRVVLPKAASALPKKIAVKTA